MPSFATSHFPCSFAGIQYMVACKIGITFIVAALNLHWRLATINGQMLVRLDLSYDFKLTGSDCSFQHLISLLLETFHSNLSGSIGDTRILKKGKQFLSLVGNSANVCITNIVI